MLLLIESCLKSFVLPKWTLSSSTDVDAMYLMFPTSHWSSKRHSFLELKLHIGVVTAFCVVTYSLWELMILFIFPKYGDLVFTFVLSKTLWALAASGKCLCNAFKELFCNVAAHIFINKYIEPYSLIVFIFWFLISFILINHTSIFLQLLSLRPF